MGTSNLLQAISDMNITDRPQKIILASSRSVYGEGDYLCEKCGRIHPAARSVEKMKNGDFAMYCDNCGVSARVVATTERSDIRPNSLYAFTKFSQEKMIETMCNALNMDYTIFRFQNVYGVGQSLKNPYTGILSIFSTLLLDDKDVNIFEDGMESRDFINVLDIASAVVNSIEIARSNGEIINLGSGIGTSVLEVANLLKNYYGSNSKINVTGDFRIGDIAHCFADITKASEILEFKPSVEFRAGIQEFCEWVKMQERDNSQYENSLREMKHTGLFIKQSQD